MRTLISIALAAAIGLPSLARAQARVDIRVALPVILPPLVVVSPGVQVVPEVDEEVFLVNGWYWVRRDRIWYRSRVHTGGWVLAPARVVPAGLVRIPPGHYRNWKAARDERKEERKEERREEKREKHREKHEHGHGHGH